MAVILPNGRNYFTTDAGLPLVGGRLHTYIPGTSTPKATYTTSAGVTPNTNPVIADARGEMVIYWDGSYDVVLRDSTGALIWGPERLEDAAGNLADDLADTASASNGGGMVGRSQTLNYAVRTLGYKAQETVDIAWFLPDETGATDSSAMWQAAAALAGGKRLVATPGATYLLEDEVVLLPNTTVDLAGSTINFDIVGNLYGFKCDDYCEIFGGTINQINATSEPGVNASFRSCITIGSFNATPARGNVGCYLHDLALTNARPDGTVIGYYADSRNCRIERVTMDGSSKVCKNGLTLHYGLLTGTPSDGTLHPWGLTISECDFFNLQVGIYSAAAYDFRAETTNYFSNCTRGIEIYRGDQGKAYAPSVVAPFVGKQIHVGGLMRECSEGLRVDGIQGLVGVEAPYLEVVAKIEFNGKAVGTTSDYGVTGLGFKRLDISGSNIIDSDGDGVLLQQDSNGFMMIGGSIRGCGQYGLRTLNLASIRDIFVQDVFMTGNAAANASSVKPAVLIGSLVQDYTFDNCKFGTAGSETQNCSIAYDELSVRPTITNNITYALLSTGTPVAYQVLASGGTTAQIWAKTAAMQQVFEGNKVAVSGTALTVFSGVPLTSYTGRARTIWETSTPTAGCWGTSARTIRGPALSGQPVAWTALTTATDYTAAAQGGTRANSTAVALGEWRRWSTGDTVWECTTAGTTAGAAPSIVGILIGGTVVDGTVTWTKRSDNCITSWATEGNL